VGLSLTRDFGRDHVLLDLTYVRSTPSRRYSRRSCSPRACA